MRKERSGWVAWVVFAVVTAGLVALDLTFKAWATRHLLGQPDRVLISGVLGLTYTTNTGIALGLFSGHGWSQWVLSALKIILLIGVSVYYYALPRGRAYWCVRVPLIMIFAGGLGNLIDRVRFGYVVDMLQFLFSDFAVFGFIFNLADVFVTLGFVALFPVMFFSKLDLPFLADTQDTQDA